LASVAYPGEVLNPATGDRDIVPTIEEVDGDPSYQAADIIYVKNSAVSDNGGYPLISFFGPVVSAPVDPTDTCEAGVVAYDSDYFYLCISANTWERAAIRHC